MSFMNSGAECSTSRNPLAQFTKHTGEDRSLQRDRFTGSANPQAMRSGNQPMNAADKQMMDRFVSGEAQGQNNAFAFDHMRHELSGMQGKTGSPQPGPQQGWANDFKSQDFRQGPQEVRQGTPVMGASGGQQWGAEFNQGGAGAATSQQPMSNMYAGRMGGMGYMPQMYGGGSIMSAAPMSSQVSQSNRVVELENENWEEQFKQIEEHARAQESKGKGVSEEAKTEAPLSTEDTILLEDQNFEDVWENIRKQVFSNEHDWSGEDRTAWDRDFTEFTKSRPEYGEYQFEENNMYKEQPDPFQVGVSLMESGGNLSEAALAFEAAVQKNPDHAEAWYRLGSCQAQNEKEDSAVRALERCIDLQPDNLNALMTLAVSYTNESYENAAYSTLEKWIATKYPDIVNEARQNNPKVGNANYELHSRVTALFIKAAQLSPDGVNIDADVQDGLGVLFYGNEEFDKAIDCFSAAVAVRPNDPLLWNRLGATLANSNRSEEAIDAYSKALELRPSFVRARYNLGVSCVNIGCYHEAAQHMLTALSMNHEHESTPGSEILANHSTNLLSTLKRIFLAMNRPELANKVGQGMDINSFRAEFDF